MGTYKMSSFELGLIKTSLKKKVKEIKCGNGRVIVLVKKKGGGENGV